MKKLLLSICLLICCLTIQSQTIVRSEFFKYRYKHEITQEFTDWYKAQRDSTIISIGADSLVIFQSADTFRLMFVLAESRGADINGDKWVGTTWASLDETGLKTQTVLKLYESGILMVVTCYGNLELCYQCRPIKKPKGIIT